jgi:hypothetical protein
MSEYMSDMKVMDKSTSAATDVLVRIYDTANYEYHESDFEFLLVLHSLKDITVPIGCLEISADEDGIRIHDVWNLKPGLFSGVGTILMHEAITSLVFYSAQYQHIASDNTQLDQFQYERYLKWKEITETKTPTISIDSVFEAMPFYDKLAFKLSNPEDEIVSHPLVPLFRDNLKEIEDLCTDPESLENDEYMKHYKHALENAGLENILATGIVTRFNDGNPTESDWIHLLEWNRFNSATSLSPVVNDVHRDYYDFISEHPDAKNFVEYEQFMLPGWKVLENEKERIKIHGPRKGMHYSVKMTLDIEKYIQMFQ